MIKFIDLKTVDNTNDVSGNREGNKDGENVYVNTTFSQETVSSVYEVLRTETRNNPPARKEQLKPCRRALYWCRQNAVHVVVGIHSALWLSVVVMVGVHRGSVTDGEWSSWAQWEQCSATCDVGMQHRFRKCNNPESSFGGKHCTGESSESHLCRERSCPVVNGEWSAWLSWGPCSFTSNAGLQSRVRTCTNPEPSLGGKHCIGESSQYQLCEKNSAADHFSAFSVSGPNKCSYFRTTDGPFFYRSCNFTRFNFQYGRDFNFSTGAFNCSVHGTYLFSANLVKINSSSPGNNIDCYLHKYPYRRFPPYFYERPFHFEDYDRLARLYLNPGLDDTTRGHTAMSSTIVESLEPRDLVTLYCSPDPATTLGYWSTFTGVMLNQEAR